MSKEVWGVVIPLAMWGVVMVGYALERRNPVCGWARGCTKKRGRFLPGWVHEPGCNHYDSA